MGNGHPTIKSKCNYWNQGAKGALGNITIGRPLKNLGQTSSSFKRCSTTLNCCWYSSLNINCDTEKRKLRHDMLPDVNRAMFEYMLRE